MWGTVWGATLKSHPPSTASHARESKPRVITAAREEIALEVGGVEAAKPFEKLSSAAWLKQ
jgi:hypothetical protein